MNWGHINAAVYRLRANLLAQSRPIAGGGSQASAVAELRARADAIDPGPNVEPPPSSRPVSWREWAAGIRSIDGETPKAADWVQPIGDTNAVRLGEYRWDDGVNWRSLIDFNTTKPAEGRWWTQEDPSLDPEPGPELTIIQWAAGLSVTVDDTIRYSYDGRVYRVIQAHTTQAGWTPNVVPALFADEGPAP